jgi:hypothetical protein
MALAEELYKALIDESKTYREKVSSVWLQKFTMLGGIIVFAALRSEATAKNPTLISAAILALPVVAVLLDVKIAEFGIHARVIDDFIMRNFPEPPILGEWERTKWGDPKTADRALIWCRSIATVAVTVVPTCLIAVLSSLAADSYLSEPARHAVHIAAAVFCLIYLVLGCASGPAVLFRRIPPRAERKRPDEDRD